MNKLSFSLLLALFLTAFSTNAAAQNQVFEIVNTANIYKKTNSFRGDFALLGTSNREGVIDKNGRELIPCHHIPYAISSPLTLFDEERLAVENRDNNLHGYYDTEGNVAIPFIYKRSGSFEGGHVPVERENGKWGVIDKNGIQQVAKGDSKCVFHSIADLVGNTSVKHEYNITREWLKSIYERKEGAGATSYIVGDQFKNRLLDDACSILMA